MGYFGRALRILQEEGPLQLVDSAQKFVWRMAIKTFGKVFWDINTIYTPDGSVYRATRKYPIGRRFTWYIPERRSDFLIECIYFSKMTDRYLPHLSRGDTILEVGAATGEYTIPAAERVGEDGRVYAFEANEANYECLEKNLELHDLNNVEIESSAVSDRSGKELEFIKAKDSLFFHQPLETKADALEGINPHEEDSWSVETKISVCVDEYCKSENIERLDLLKLTVNNHEYTILQGAEDILEATEHVLLPYGYPQAVAFLEKREFEIVEQRKRGFVKGETLLQSRE